MIEASLTSPVLLKLNQNASTRFRSIELKREKKTVHQDTVRFDLIAQAHNSGQENAKITRNNLLYELIE